MYDEPFGGGRDLICPSLIGATLCQRDGWDSDPSPQEPRWVRCGTSRAQHSFANVDVQAHCRSNIINSLSLACCFLCQPLWTSLKQATWSAVCRPHGRWLAQETQTAFSVDTNQGLLSSRVPLRTALLLWLMKSRDCPGGRAECHSFRDAGKAVLKWGLNLAACPLALLYEYIQTPGSWVELCCSLPG